MDSSGGWHNTKCREGAEKEADRDEAIGDMKHEDETVAPGSLSGPTGQSDGLDKSSQNEEPPGWQCVGKGDPRN